MDKTERFEILMDPETRNLLRRLADMEKESQASIFRRALREYAERRGIKETSR